MTENQTARRMAEEFRRFCGGGDPPLVVRAPGRVNLIGEHTDYNDGFVLPVGLECAVWVAGRAATGRVSRFRSVNFNEEHSFDADRMFERGAHGWGVYVEGVARVLEESLGPLPAVEAVVWGDVPLGSGLSSSAALEVAAGFFLLEAAGAAMPLPDLARACQAAENRFAGVQCGIMDQFASCLAGQDAAVFLDCRSLEFEYVPVVLDDFVLLVLNTNVPRTLAGSAYNDRRASCEQGVRILRQSLPHIRALRDVTLEQFRDLEHLLPPETAPRCRHVVSENRRALDSVAALRNGDMSAFGELMNASHRSLRDDYEVTCRELDLLHAAACGMKGVAGERMTGAGFGGCAVALVRKDCAAEVEARLREVYQRETGRALDVYVTRAMPGVRRIEL